MNLEKEYINKIKSLENEISCRQHSEVNLVLC